MSLLLLWLFLWQHKTAAVRQQRLQHVVIAIATATNVGALYAIVVAFLVIVVVANACLRPLA